MITVTRSFASRSRGRIRLWHCIPMLDSNGIWVAPEIKDEENYEHRFIIFPQDDVIEGLEGLPPGGMVKGCLRFIPEQKAVLTVRQPDGKTVQAPYSTKKSVIKRRSPYEPKDVNQPKRKG